MLFKIKQYKALPQNCGKNYKAANANFPVFLLKYILRPKSVHAIKQFSLTKQYVWLKKTVAVSSDSEATAGGSSHCLTMFCLDFEVVFFMFQRMQIATHWRWRRWRRWLPAVKQPCLTRCNMSFTWTCIFSCVYVCLSMPTRHFNWSVFTHDRHYTPESSTKRFLCDSQSVGRSVTWPTKAAAIKSKYRKCAK